MTAPTSPADHLLRNHYVICNWNAKTLDIIAQLHTDETGIAQSAIVVVTQRPIDESMLPKTAVEREKFRDVVFYPGDPTTLEVLRNVGCSRAKAIIVLTDRELGVEADARNLLTLFALQSLELEPGNQPHIVTEILDVANYAKFRQFEEDGDRIIEIIRAESLRTRILAQAARTPGLVNFFHDLLTYSADSNEVYSVPIPETWIQEGTTTYQDIATRVLKLRYAEQADGFFVGIPIGLWVASKRKITVNPDNTQPASYGDAVVLISRSHPWLKP